MHASCLFRTCRGILRVHVHQARHTPDDMQVCPVWRGRGRHGPKRVTRSVRSHQKYERLYIPNLPAQLRRRGR